MNTSTNSAPASETVTIPRGLLEALTHYAVYLADSSLEIAKNNVRLEGAIVGAQALLSAPQGPDQLAIERKHRAQDWTDDHDHLEVLLKKHGFTDERIYPTDYCPTISDLADMLEKHLAGDLERLRAAIREHREAVEFAHLQNAFDWDRRLWSALE